MANPHKGEVALQCEGRTLTLLFDINALAELEDHLDLNSTQIIARMQGGMRLNMLKAMIWAACREHHPEVTVKAAGAIIQEVTIVVAEAAVTKAVQLSFPQAAEDAKAPDDPPKALEAAGAGQTSTSSGASLG